MSCDPNRIELSNLATTQITFTVSGSPDDGTNLILSIPGLSISETVSLTSGSGSVSIGAVSADDFEIFDATIQIGTNAGATAAAVVVPTTNPSGIGVNISGSAVTYCAPTGGGGVAGVSSIIAGTNVTLSSTGSGGTGDVTVNAASGSGSGTVTEVTGTTPISVASGTTTPQITHADSGVLAGITPYPRSFTVNATGHVTGSVSGTEPSPLAGSTSIVTVGTIATGTWNGTTIGTAYGGTGATSVPMVGLITAANAAAARTVLEVVNVGSYTGQIETVAAKTYTLDPAAATDRTLSGLYMKTGADSCTVTVKNGSSDVIASQSITTSTGAITISNNLAVSADDALAIEVTAISGTPTDLIFSLEYTE